MTIRLNPRWLLISAVLFSLQFCRAQTEIPPSLSFDLGPSVAPETQLWDLTGDYDLHFDITANNGLSIPVEVSFSLNQDASGKLTGSAGNVSGLVFNNDDNSAFAITTKIAGKVNGSGGFARAHFTVHFSGNGSFGGIQNVVVSGSFTVDADTSSGDLSGRVKDFRSKIGNLNRINGRSDFSANLPTDGSWNLSLNVAGLTQFVGVGAINMPQHSFGIDLKGKFNNNLAVIALQAKGAGDVPNTISGKGSNPKIFLTPSFDTLQVEGRVLGQRMSFNVGTTPD